MNKSVKGILAIAMILILSILTVSASAETLQIGDTLIAPLTLVSAKSDPPDAQKEDAAAEASSLEDREGFSIREISDDLFDRMKRGNSYKEDCIVPREDLRYLLVLHKDKDGKTHQGEMVVHKRIAEDVLEIFEKLYDADYPIERMVLPDNYLADDETMMRDNNSSSFNFRFISHTNRISKHGLGMAVDINTLYNPYHKIVTNDDGTTEEVIEPATGEPYLDRTKDFDYKIEKDDLCYKLFTEKGFEWGGDWTDRKDYQHFELPTDITEKYSEAYAGEKTDHKSPTVLLILDGFGLNERSEHNAIALADTPVLDRLMEECPFVKGEASGPAVGLPDGQMGSSEVGHLNIGAGRIVYQDLARITREIENGDFFENEALLKAVNNAKEKGTSLHIYGLVSDGGVHSHNTHLYALLELAKRHGLEKVYVHCFMDGRDTSPESGKDYVQELQDEMDRIGCGRIATVAGRYYAMDRDNNWDRIEKAYRALTLGEGVTASSAVEAVTQSYEKGETDEFIQPTVVMEDGAPVATIGDGDSIIFFNFRPDRAREITRAFCCDEFDSFDRGPRKQVTYVCFTDYDVTIPNKDVAFEKETIPNTFGEWLAANGLKQARIAETEKYAHVTFFFNGGVEDPNEGEDRFLIPSPKVATYDLQPEMSAPAVCDTIVEKIRSGEYDVIIANFANSDMVGHTGVEKAAIEAVSTIDKCIGRVVEAIEEVDGQLFICADHGNSEMMVDYETGEPWTAHTTNPVPFILVNYDPDYTLREGGCLADIAPTLIEMMGMEKPAEMTGESLLIKK